VNGKETGTAITSVIKKDNTYISYSEYSMNVSGMKIITKDTIIETIEFKPIRLENYSRIENNGEVTESTIVSVIKGKK